MNTSSRLRNSGATMAVTLLLLFVLTLLAVSSIQVTQLQEKMSANLQDKELSFNAAESALTAGENWVRNLSNEPVVYIKCGAYPCVEELKTDFDYVSQTSNWWASNSAVHTTNIPHLASPPRYIVEYMRYVPDNPTVGDSSQKSTGVYYYQITAQGSGSSPEAISILQSVIARRY